jgi:diguanylate cyclase (GGDEF)-like protein
MEPAVPKKATGKSQASIAQKDRRLRAAYRRDLRESVFFSAMATAMGISAATLAGCAISPETAAALAALSLPLIAAAVALGWSVRRRARHLVVPLGIAVGLLPIAYLTMAVLLLPRIELLALGCFGLIPLGFALFIPLDRRPHATWLAAADAIFFGLLILVGRQSSWNELPALLFAATVASVLSLAANETLLRRRHQIDDQLVAVRSLYGRMKEHELDLRRQDEFLVMQQETLVVQQAELLRLNEELETIARLDALTGLGNRLRLNEDLAGLAARIVRSGGTAGLLLMDLDRFKRLNDSMGHLAGDAALRGVADVLRKTSRLGDGLYRYGGEEFLVILHGADESVLQSAGQRYLTAIEAAGMIHVENAPYGVVTASAGGVELSQSNCRDIDSALHDADEALYEAKALGRNRMQVRTLRLRATVVALDQQRAAS